MKRTRIILIVILALTANLNGYSQTKKADKLFEFYNYAEAIPLYLKVVESENKTENIHAIERLADCYRYTNNVAQARIWYGKAIEVDKSNSMNFYYLGQALRGLGLYQPAAEAFKQFNILTPDSLEGDKYYQFCIDIQEWEDLPDMAEIKNIKAINTKYSDFGPALYKDGIVFTSDRKLDLLDNTTYGWTNFNYLNLYITKPEYYHSFWDGVPLAKKMSRDFNQSYHDGPACFTSDYKRVYITKTVGQKPKKSADKIRTHLLKIYYADIVGDKKLQFEPLPFNNDLYSVAHPTISKSSNQLIFSSDMPNGFGGSDLYVSTLENGKWSSPENLGGEVNSKGDEVFPYWANDTVLIYSSDGLLGYGGLDIFQTKLVGGKWSKPENLKKPLNSSYDDFGVVLLENQKEGLFSSNRPGGEGSDDIYAFRKLKYAHRKVVAPKLLVSGFVKEFATNEPLNDATVFMFNPANEEVTILKSDKNGYYKTNIEYDFPFVVKAMKNGYIYDCTTFRTPKDNTIKEYRVPRDLLLAKLEVDQKFKVANIYYDLDKWFIREDAKLPLDNLVRIMKKYPITAELSSHTDSRASNEYNNELSQKRAESAVRYMVLQGINPARITAKGYGETQLVNKCADGVDCTEAEHQANRRTEFKITGIDATQAEQNLFDPQVFKEGDVISAKLLDPDFFSDCLIKKASLKDYLMPTKDVKKEVVLLKETKKKKNVVEDKKPNVVVKENVSGTTYRIQLLATTKTLNIPEYFSKIGDLIEKYGISIQKIGKLNKYQLGNFSTRHETIEIRKALIQKGYKDCFVVKVEN